jgi:hypothetical protein
MSNLTNHIRQCLFSWTLTKLQAITYVKLRSTNGEAVRTRKELVKEQFLIEKYSKWMSGDITRQQFLFAVSYKNQPLVK